MNLPYDEIQEIHAEALKSGLHNKRALLLAGIPTQYVAGLDVASNPSDQLLIDLDAMNQVGAIVDGVIPLERWLRNAAYATSTIPDRQRYFRQLADDIAAKSIAASAAPPAVGPPPAVSSPPAVGTQQERVLFVSELLPLGFLEGAGRTGKSVVRLIVPRFNSGQPFNQPASDEQVQYYGTGWLIGPKHVITNHHVINARDPGEPLADASDFACQARKTTVQFDYDNENSAGEKFAVAQLSAADAKLDFAILELDREAGRSPLSIWGKPIELTAASRLPLNIIQHPGGQPKQMAIRNNLAAAISGSDLAYYTETNGGSSGSPVCNDRWQVLALHRSATMTLGKFTYQGKETAWINTGTLMRPIVDQLQQQHADLWQRIGATMI
jgi:endonuclease G